MVKNVMQKMFLGNLETIHLRALVLQKLKEMLNVKDYRPAVEMMRGHRIDMNLLFDHNPEVSFLTYYLHPFCFSSMNSCATHIG